VIGELYEHALAGQTRPEIEHADGSRKPLPVEGWLHESPGDKSLLDRCVGPTLDIGSGPGRLTVALAERGIRKITGLLLDLGVSSPQIDTPERGFSFRFDGPLDMRMDTTRGETAADFLARADERHIAEVIRDYGEERFAVSIAKALVAVRESGAPVRTTRELSAVVARTVKTR